MATDPQTHMYDPYAAANAQASYVPPAAPTSGHYIPNIPPAQEYRPALPERIPVIDTTPGAKREVGEFVATNRPTPPTRFGHEPQAPAPGSVASTGFLTPVPQPPAPPMGTPIGVVNQPTVMLAPDAAQAPAAAALWPQQRLRMMLGMAPTPPQAPAAVAASAQVRIPVDFAIRYPGRGAEVAEQQQAYQVVLESDGALIFAGVPETFWLPPTLPPGSVALQVNDKVYLAVTVDISFEYDGLRFGIMVIEDAQQA